MNERNIMAELRDQINIAKLYFSFESKDYLVFVMEYYAGGELFNLVKKFRKMD
jgi:serum/glucocorticoid-regulated kinase 2